MSGVIERDFATPGLLLIFGGEPNRIDILNSLKGLSFNEPMKDSKKVILDEVPTRIVSLEHLFNLKKIANRPQDKLDLVQLRKVQRKPR